MICFDNNDNIITINIIMIIKPEGRQLHKQCWQEQGPRWPENRFWLFKEQNIYKQMSEKIFVTVCDIRGAKCISDIWYFSKCIVTAKTQVHICLWLQLTLW